MDDIIAIEYDATPTIANMLALAEQLAAVTAERDALALELSHLRPEWQALRDERDALAAQVLALQVDRSKAVKLRDETDNIIWSLTPDVIPGAINWGDLGVREVQEVVNEERCWWRVVIEEADPVNPTLHTVVLARLVALGWNADDIEIVTEW